MNVDTGEQSFGGSSKRKSLPDLGETQKNITMAAIAKASGVSQGAISSLLNDRDYGIRVSEKTRSLVFKVCRELGYVPNDLRAVVRMYPELGDLGLFFANSNVSLGNNSAFARVVSAATAASAAGQLTISPFDLDLDYTSATLPRALLLGVISKFLLFGKANLSLLETIVNRGYRACCIDEEVSLPGITNFVPDYEQAAQLALEHLFGLGHREVVVLSGAFGGSDYRIDALSRGTRAAFEKAGLHVQTQNVIYGDLSAESGRLAAQEVLARPQRPTAIFSFSDAAAAGFISVVAAAGIAVPSQISVLGCSDDPAGLLLERPLTTIELPFEALAEKAVAAAEEAAAQETPDLSASHRVVLPVSLLERASTAAP